MARKPVVLVTGASGEAGHGPIPAGTGTASRPSAATRRRRRDRRGASLVSWGRSTVARGEILNLETV